MISSRIHMSSPPFSMTAAQFPKCCDLLRRRRIFAKLAMIGDEDYLSTLPIDCLYSIFEYLNHDDLDVVSAVSQTIGIVVNTARFSMKKGQAQSLEIYQLTNFDIVLLLTENSGKSYSMSLKKEHNQLKEARFEIFSDSIPDELDGREVFPPAKIGRKIPCFVYDRIRYLLLRFDIANLNLNSILIDRHFLMCCEEVFRGDSLRRLVPGINIQAFSLILEESLLQDDRKLFLNWIASLRPHKLRMDSELLNVGLADVRFVDKLRLNGNCTEITGFFRGQVKVVPSYPLPNVFYRSISKFTNLNLRSFVMDVEHLMDVIEGRLTLQKEGSLYISTSKHVDRDFIAISLKDKEFELEAARDGELSFLLKPMHLDWYAILTPTEAAFSPGINATFINSL